MQLSVARRFAPGFLLEGVRQPSRLIRGGVPLAAGLGLLTGLFLLAGCGTGSGGPAAIAPVLPAAFQINGTVHGGQQPISGGTIQLWQVGTTGYGTGAVALGSSATTGVTGSFTLTGNYSCSDAANGNNSLIYLTATGGNPGLAAGTSNGAIAMMVALGPCGNLTPNTYISVNEVTTVASVYSLAQFMGANGQVGSYGTSNQGLTNAFATVANLVDIASGKALAVTPNGNGVVPQAELNTLGDIVAPCVNSAGPSSSTCASLFSTVATIAGAAPTTTLGALLSIAQNPSHNVTALLNLTSPAAPFQPTLSSASDWTVAIGYGSGGTSPRSLAVDATGNIWVANFGTGGATSSLSMLSPTGVPASNSPFSGAAYANGASGVAVDNGNHVWVANHDVSSAVEFNVTTGAGGGTIAVMGTPFTSIGLNGPTGVAVDPANNIWFTNTGGNSVTQLPNTGCASTTCATTYTGNGLSTPQGIALDASGNAWVANSSGASVTRIVPNGTSGSFTGGGLTTPTALAIDGTSNVWVTDGSLAEVTELNSNGLALSSANGFTGGGISGASAVAIDGGGAVWVAGASANALSQFSPGGTALTPAAGYQGGSLSAPNSIGIDASGNLWVANGTPKVTSGIMVTVSEFVGLATPTIMPLAQAVQKGQLGQAPGAPIVAKNPVASPGGPYSGLTGTAVSFSGANSTDPKDQALSYSWTFGDGAGGSGVTPTHAYFSAGTYVVSLTVTDTDGKQSTATTSASILASAVQSPTAVAGGPYSGTAFASVLFSGLRSSDPLNLVAGPQGLTYTWNFGDGSQGSGPTPVHTYGSAGTFNLSLTVQSLTSGATATATGTAVIAAGTAATGAPVASPGGPYTSKFGAPITFSSAGSSDPNSLPITYVWDFGDGNSSTDPSPTYTYTTAGSYSVTLSVSNGTNITLASTSATIATPVVPAMAASAGGPYTVAVNQLLTLSSAGTTNPTGRQLDFAWDFGDGTSSIGTGPAHAYAASGKYTVNLHVSDGAMQNANATASVTVTGPAPEAIVALIGGPYQDAVGQTIVFDASRSTDNLGSALTYTWNFGDGSTGTGVTPSHAYASVGNYTVTLTVSSAAVSSSATTTVPITAPLTVHITTPVANSLFSNPTVSVSGDLSASSLSVSVNGVAATVSGTSFTATGVPLREGSNLLTATATDGHGSVGTGVVNVLLDVTAPLISITSPASGATVSASSIAVAGLVSDSVTSTLGTNSIAVTVDGQAAQVSNKSYLLSNLQLVPGINTITVVATDSVGNTSTVSQKVNLLPGTSQLSIVKLTGDAQIGAVQSVLPQPLVVQLVSTSGSPVAGRPITFTVTRSDGVVEVLPATSQALSVTTDANGKASVLFKLGSRSGLGINQVSATTPGAAASAIFTESTSASTPNQIHVVRGDTQRGLIGQPLALGLQTVVMDAYGNPVPGVTVTYTNAGATDGAIDHPSTVTDAAGEAIANLTLGQQEGINNYDVTADFVGNTGSPVSFIASSYAPGPIANTSVSGVVLDNTQTPVQNAMVTLAGTTLRTNTNASGAFTLSGAPVGTVSLTVDGSTATTTNTLPFLSFVLQALPGVNNTIGKPIYLPIIDINNGQTVGGPDPVTLTMTGVPGVAFTVAPNSVTFPDGSTVGKLSLSQVKSDLVPMEPNDGTGPNVVYTLQPAGTRFSVPIQMTIPNTQALAPGLVTDIYQYDHDLEQFVSIGTGHVSADGSVINSDPGFGITKAGWDHCCTPVVSKACGISCTPSTYCVIATIRSCTCKFNNAPNGTACGPHSANLLECRDQGQCISGSCHYNFKTDGSSCTGENLYCSSPYQCQSGDCVGTPIAPVDAPGSTGGKGQSLSIEVSVKSIPTQLSVVTSKFIAPLEVTPKFSVENQISLVCCEATKTKNVPVENDKLNVGLDLMTKKVAARLPNGFPLGYDFGDPIGFEGVYGQFGGTITGTLQYTDDQCLKKTCVGGGVTIGISATGGIQLITPIFGASIALTSGFSGGVNYACPDILSGNITFSGIKLTGSAVLFTYINIPVNYQPVDPIVFPYSGSITDPTAPTSPSPEPGPTPTP